MYTSSSTPIRPKVEMITYGRMQNGGRGQKFREKRRQPQNVADNQCSGSLSALVGWLSPFLQFLKSAEHLSFHRIPLTFRAVLDLKRNMDSCPSCVHEKSAEPQKTHLICPRLYCQDFEPRFLTASSMLFACLVAPLGRDILSEPEGRFPSLCGRSKKQKAHPIGHSLSPKVEASPDFVLMAGVTDLAENISAMAGDCHCRRRMAFVLCCLGF